MSADFSEWLHNSFILLLTLSVYAVALFVYRKGRQASYLHPILISVGLLLVILSSADMSISDYQQQTAWLSWLLAPATIALAVPLYNQISRIKSSGVRLYVPILVGGGLAPIIAVLVLLFGDIESGVLATMWTKSITTPLAMQTSAIIGGYPALAAVIVIATGILAAIIAQPVFFLFAIDREVDQGLALGTVGHAVGTAAAIQKGERCGAFATLALCLNGVITALTLPLLVALFI